MKAPLLIALLMAVACSKKTETVGQMPQVRLTPSQVRQIPTGEVGTSGVGGVHTKVLFGAPSRRGFYSVLEFIPAGTTIKPHSHRDDRVATVISGTLRVGDGNTFNEGALEDLPAGSIYTEPSRQNHFAQTTAEPVIVQFTGFGPTDTKYVNPSDAPPTQQ